MKKKKQEQPEFVKKKYKVVYTRSIIVEAVDDYDAKNVALESEGWEEDNGKVEEL